MAQQLQALGNERKGEERRSPSPTITAQKRPLSPSSSASSCSGGVVTPAKQQRLEGENNSVITSVANMVNTSTNSEGSPPKGYPAGQIKAKGTYYPLTAFPTKMPQGAVMHRDNSPPRERASGSSGKEKSRDFAEVALTELLRELTSALFA